MIKKNRKWIIGVLAFCLIWCVSVPVSVYALNPTVLISNATINVINDEPRISSSTNRNVYVIDLEDVKSGTITLSFAYASWSGVILFSNDDIPSNVQMNYYFISSDFYSFSNSDMDPFDFINVRYIYISSNRSFTYNITYKANPTPTNTPTPTPTDTPTPTPTNSPTPSPEPTDPINPSEPTNTPTPMPTGSGGSGIPLHYLVPFDYYMIAIIILLGGLLICQLFKN